MTAQGLIELLQHVNPDAPVQMQSVEEPDAGLVDIAIIYDEGHVEIIERLD